LRKFDRPFLGTYYIKPLHYNGIITKPYQYQQLAVEKVCMPLFRDLLQIPKEGFITSNRLLPNSLLAQ
jgi:hypothetical protein